MTSGSAPGMVIGVDFDNTVISYEDVFRAAAIERGVPLQGDAEIKRSLREHLRQRHDGELEWRRLQAAVYGRRIGDARLMHGVGEFFRRCRQKGTSCYIVSHKTEVSAYADEPVNLREAAVAWMEAHGFFSDDGFGLARHQVFFASSRAEKIARIESLGCTHFIDDLEEVLLDPRFPLCVERLLFGPSRANGVAGVPVFSSWERICDHLFGSWHD